MRCWCCWQVAGGSKHTNKTSVRKSTAEMAGWIRPEGGFCAELERVREQSRRRRSRESSPGGKANEGEESTFWRERVGVAAVVVVVGWWAVGVWWCSCSKSVSSRCTAVLKAGGADQANQNRTGLGQFDSGTKAKANLGRSRKKKALLHLCSNHFAHSPPTAATTANAARTAGTRSRPATNRDQPRSAKTVSASERHRTRDLAEIHPM